MSVNNNNSENSFPLESRRRLKGILLRGQYFQWFLGKIKISEFFLGGGGGVEDLVASLENGLPLTL